MRRRDFVTLLVVRRSHGQLLHKRSNPSGRGGSACCTLGDDRDTRVQAYLPAFKQRLHKLGWIEGRNIRFDYRFTGARRRTDSRRG